MAEGGQGAERFARLMRELKERSGLSYGVLARKLHTSTSTLHRYCNGEAVPTEFAAVDRFARACGASPGEAVDLHRAWLLADARRRATPRSTPPTDSPPTAAPGGSRSARVGAEAEPGAGAGTPASPDAEPATAAGGAVAARREPGEAVAGPSGPSAEPVAGPSGPEAGPSAGGGASGGPSVELGPVAGGGVPGGPGVGAGEGDGALDEAVRGPWYRGRRAVAGAVVGVAAVALAAAGLAMAGQPDSGRPQAGSSPVAGPSAAPSSGHGTGNGMGAGTPTSPAPSGTGAATGPGPAPGPSAAPSPSTAAPTVSTPAPPPAPAPRTAVRSHVWANGCDHAYLLRQGPQAVPAPPVEADAPAWATARQAVHAGRQIVEVTVHGTGADAVVLQGLDVRVTARRTPPPWNVFLMSPGCGGSLTPAAFAVNLDAPRPLARPVAGHDGERPVPAPAFPLRVTAAEPVVLRIEASATGCDCDWYAELRWSSAAGSGVVRIDDNGRTLRTSAAPGRPRYGYAGELGRWSKD
ncbi:transcriptional regulator [Streptomyces venezuelae]|nr:helix-turn-helix domain-containing protein [Streptomyces venezuelae]